MRRKELLSSLLGSLVLLSLLISLFSGGLVCYASTGEAELAGATRLTIIHTNDTHARVREGDGMGFARISAIVREIKKENPNVLLLDAGDTFHGQAIASLNKGESIVRIMNEIGYDAMAPGNHDFNYGYDRLLSLAG